MTFFVLTSKKIVRNEEKSRPRRPVQTDVAACQDVARVRQRRRDDRPGERRVVRKCPLLRNTSLTAIRPDPRRPGRPDRAEASGPRGGRTGGKENVGRARRAASRIRNSAGRKGGREAVRPVRRCGRPWRPGRGRAARPDVQRSPQVTGRPCYAWIGGRAVPRPVRDKVLQLPCIR